MNLVNWQDRQNLKDTGLLSNDLIGHLFERDPTLKIGKYKEILLYVMNRFNIIIQPQLLAQTTTNEYQTSAKYYMPSMIKKKPTSRAEIWKIFIGGKRGFRASPWLILEFNFLPLAYFNHILFYYVRKYRLCEDTKEQHAIYRGKALLHLDQTGNRRLFICFSKNTIALQIWKKNDVDDRTYSNILEELCGRIKVLKTDVIQNLTYDVKAKCSKGDYSKILGRISCHDLTEKWPGQHYDCDEHGHKHNKEEIKNTWLRYVDPVSVISVDNRLRNFLFLRIVTVLEALQSNALKQLKTLNVIFVYLCLWYLYFSKAIPGLYFNDCVVIIRLDANQLVY